MAQNQSHFTFSVLTAVAWAGVGLSYRIDPEIAVLSAVVLTIGGILPNVDEGKGQTAQELGGLVAAISPLILLAMFPTLRAGGISRVALVVILAYTFTRILIARSLQTFFAHRGAVHSIPAAIVTSEIVYLMFPDLLRRERIFVAGAALIGFLSHLLIDAYGNLDLMQKAMGQAAAKKSPVLKFRTGHGGKTLALYGTMLVLGYLVIRDIYPGFRVFAGVQL